MRTQGGKQDDTRRGKVGPGDKYSRIVSLTYDTFYLESTAQSAAFPVALQGEA